MLQGFGGGREGKDISLGAPQHSLEDRCQWLQLRELLREGSAGFLNRV